ncbi:hypothetical protein Tco_0669235 [Tanacetum coccineum]
MFGTIPPIPPPLGADIGDTSIPNKFDSIPTNNINNTTTNIIVQDVVDENLSKLLDSRGGSHVTMFLSLIKRIFLAGKIDKRLKSIIISCLPNEVMKSVIKCTTSKAIWSDLILAHEGPSDKRDTKIATLRLKFKAFKALEGEKVNGTPMRLKFLLNDLENNGVSISQAEVNATFVNRLPRKWLRMNKTQRANNSIKIAWLPCMENTTIKKDSDSDVEEDQRGSSEFLADLNVEFHERALLANQKRFYKRSRRVGSTKKLIDKSNETLSFEDEGITKVLAFMAIAEDKPSVGKADARSEGFEKWNYSKVTIDQLLTEQVPGNIVRALGGRAKKKEKISSKEI